MDSSIRIELTALVRRGERAVPIATRQFGPRKLLGLAVLNRELARRIYGAYSMVNDGPLPDWPRRVRWRNAISPCAAGSRPDVLVIRHYGVTVCRLRLAHWPV